MGLLTPLAVRIGAISWMPKLLPQVVWVDKNLQRASKGRVTLLDVAGLPNVGLTVPGRKERHPAHHTTALRAARRRRELEGEERGRMWQVMLRTWPNFAKYQERTTRVIPVFYLQRVIDA